MTKSRSVRLFVCYSHRDEKFREALGSALSPLLLDGRIVVSHDRRITPGRDWDAAIHDEIERADVIVVLVSAHFFHSGYCTGVEMARALERAEEGTARVVPVVVRPVAWEDTPLARFQALPGDDRPVSRWRNRDEAWLEVARGLRRAWEDLPPDLDPTRSGDRSRAQAQARTTMRTVERVPTTRPEFLPIKRPFSNFEFIERRFGDVTPLRRILSQVRAHGGQSMTVETCLPSDDAIEEDEDLRRILPRFRGSNVTRLGFFRCLLGNARDLDRARDEDFLGYAVVKCDDLGGGQTCERVYESVVRPSRRPNNFVSGPVVWSASILGRSFRVLGHLYAQQNGITNSCAHVAVRTAAALFHPAGDFSYREMNDLLEVPLQAQGGGDGLDVDQIVRLLEHAGARCIRTDYTSIRAGDERHPPPTKYIYGSIESGYPVIVVFSTEEAEGSETVGHAIPIFGHTLNQDNWVPNAERSYFVPPIAPKYAPSDYWLSSFIGHDDNWGSNYCIPASYLFRHKPCASEVARSSPCIVQRNRVLHVIATLPRSVAVPPYRAELTGLHYFAALLERQRRDAHANDWVRRLVEFADRKLLVLRPLLVRMHAYAAHLEAITDWSRRRVESALVDEIRRETDELVWMIEVSLPELFPTNLRKVGEILVRADRDLSGDGGSVFLRARIPGWSCVESPRGAVPGEFEFRPCRLQSHVPLFGLE